MALNSKNPLVTVAIPTFNRSKMISRLIESILDNSYKEIEIIVVDDKSTDGTPELLRQTFPESITVIENKVNSGVTHSRNVAINAASGKYIFLIDDDNVLSKGCIKELVNVLENDQKISMAGPVMRFFKKPDEVWWAGTYRNMTTSKTSYLYSGKHKLPSLEMWETVDFPNAWMFRSSLRTTAMFDEGLRIHYEESDFAYRLRKAGAGAFVVVRKAEIFHDVSNSPEDVRRRWMDSSRVFYTARNRIVFHKRYSNPGQRAVFLIFWSWLFMAYYIKFIFGLNLGGLKNNAVMAGTYVKGTLVGFVSK